MHEKYQEKKQRYVYGFYGIRESFLNNVNVKLECVGKFWKFCFFGVMFGAGAWRCKVYVECLEHSSGVKIKELSPFWKPHVHHIVLRKSHIELVTVQIVWSYGAETWAMKTENLKSSQRTEHMMVRWMYGFVQSPGNSLCGWCGEAGQIKMIWAFCT